ncbi:unnamed protein product [Nippostrongylus brasiliensis]|uniref:Methionyl-tRNA formyltransferase n=1 Tax=Nippostrongylus brasiliensis TaxID=27835 RepID=A0A0N4XMQ6_NIPBR|nr:unnamed protein product [Nippostrongylus brasiliensis]
MFPENIVAATFQQAQTKYVTVRPKILKVNDSIHLELLNNGTLDYVKAALEYNDGINVLGEFIEAKSAKAVENLKKFSINTHLSHFFHFNHLNQQSVAICHPYADQSNSRRER